MIRRFAQNRIGFAMAESRRSRGNENVYKTFLPFSFLIGTLVTRYSCNNPPCHSPSEHDTPGTSHADEGDFGSTNAVAWFGETVMEYESCSYGVPDMPQE
jgi:hypothetical protein